MRHPDIVDVAVVAQPDEKWGERPRAFVSLKPGSRPTEADVIAFTRGHLPGFKAPQNVEFGPLPRTSTGKVRKNELRDRVLKRSTAETGSV